MRSSLPLAARKTIIEELEESMSGQAIGCRAEKLRRLSDLFLDGPASRSDSEVAVFDDVMTRLIDQMEMSVRSELAHRFAAIPNAPVKLMRMLAADQAIDVAGPVLAKSPCLDDDILAEYARTKDQPHLLAISRREAIGEAVTDVLVARGDRAVVLSTVGNSGARLSEGGRAILVDRAKDDDELAAGVWSRSDISRHHLLRLFTVASENVRKSLESADRRKTAFIRDMVVDVANRMQSKIRAGSRDYAAARQVVGDMHRTGRLCAADLEQFATARRFDETTVALSILCDLPLGAIERAMVQDRSELVLLLARAIGLSWTCTMAILRLRAGTDGLSAHEIDRDLATFTKLRSETAHRALLFLRLRERAASDHPPAATTAAAE
jgi:uncharacterized protein (DUF2336 family)